MVHKNHLFLLALKSETNSSQENLSREFSHKLNKVAFNCNDKNLRSMWNATHVSNTDTSTKTMFLCLYFYYLFLYESFLFFSLLILLLFIGSFLLSVLVVPVPRHGCDIFSYRKISFQCNIALSCKPKLY